LARSALVWLTTLAAIEVREEPEAGALVGAGFLVGFAVTAGFLVGFVTTGLAVAAGFLVTFGQVEADFTVPVGQEPVVQSEAEVHLEPSVQEPEVQAPCLSQEAVEQLLLGEVIWQTAPPAVIT